MSDVDTESRSSVGGVVLLHCLNLIYRRHETIFIFEVYFSPSIIHEFDAEWTLVPCFLFIFGQNKPQVK